MNAISPALSKLLEQCKTFDGHDGYSRTVPEGLSLLLKEAQEERQAIDLVYALTTALLSVEVGEISEDQAAELLNIETLKLQEARTRTREFLHKQWAEYRAANPPRLTNINEQGQPLTKENLAEIEKILYEHSTPIDDAEFIEDMRQARAQYMAERNLSEEQMIARENEAAAGIAGLSELYDEVREEPQQPTKQVNLTNAEKIVIRKLYQKNGAAYKDTLLDGMDRQLISDALYCLVNQTPYVKVTALEVYALTEQGFALAESWEPQQSTAPTSTIPDQTIFGSLPDDMFGRTMKVNENGCGCHACNPRAAWFVVCSKCGNKRCPHATNHENDCTGSNKPGQEGSIF